MRFILQKGNIFATNLLYMNDSEEYKNGLRELQTIINARYEETLISDEQVELELSKDTTMYSISFSTAKDLLSQWSMYAGESGVSIAMEFSGEEKYKAYEDKTRKYVSKRRMEPHTVYYCTKNAMSEGRYQSVVQKIWKQIEKRNKETLALKDIRGNATYLWKEMTPYVKRFEFNAEGEYRLVFDWSQLLRQFRIDYRNDNNVLKPYLDIECEGGWPIFEITVGPGFNQDVVFRSVLHFLNHADLKVRSMTEKQFLRRCKKYFESCGEWTEETFSIWESRKEKIANKDVEIRYDAFLSIRQDILNALDKSSEVYANIKNKEMTKVGIILSRSAIPYIF